MRNSIAITLMVVIAIFGFVSGYSIGFKNAGSQASSSPTESHAISNSYDAPAGTAEESEASSAAAGGYGAPAEKAGDSSRPGNSSAPEYGR